MKITNLVKCYENHVVINRLTLDLEKEASTPSWEAPAAAKPPFFTSLWAF